MSTRMKLMKYDKSLKRKAEAVKAFSPGSLVMTPILVQPFRACLFRDISDFTEVERTYLSKGQNMPVSFGRSRQHNMKK